MGMDQGAPFAAGLKQGEVCHFLELAIHKKLLAYKKGKMVPYQTKLNSSNLPEASLKKARGYLKSLLESEPYSGIKLPNIPRLFESKYGTQLSPTALGKDTLSDLLCGEDFRDICVLERDDHRNCAVVKLRRQRWADMMEDDDEDWDSP